jgi:flagellar biosynthesis chaperone FliJ
MAHRWSRACGELVGWSARVESELNALQHVETLLSTVESSLDKADVELASVAEKEKNRFQSLSRTRGNGFSVEQQRFWDTHREAFFRALRAHQSELHRLNAALVAQEGASGAASPPPDDLQRD